MEATSQDRLDQLHNLFKKVLDQESRCQNSKILEVIEQVRNKFAEIFKSEYWIQNGLTAELAQKKYTDNLFNFFTYYYSKGIFLPIHRFPTENKSFFPLQQEDFDVYWTQNVENKPTKLVRSKTNEITEQYFIHRHLSTFLLKEWQTYLHNTSNDSNFYPQTISLKLDNMVQDIIKYLSKLENTKLWIWETPKPINKTHYCLSLYFIPDELLDDILINTEQRTEWVELYPEKTLQIAINKYIYAKTPKEREQARSELKAYEFLPIDTKYFEDKFIQQLLSQIPQLESDPDGILIKGENWQALNHLQDKFPNSFQCIYIDPPYNTGNENFLYNDKYPHYAWLVMMANRLELAKPLLKEDGLFYCSIDDNEQPLLKLLVDHIFGSNFPNIIWHKKTQPSFLTKELIPVTEYILVAKKSLNPIRLWGAFGDKQKLTEMINISNSVSTRILPLEHTIINNGWSGELPPGRYGKDKLQVELIVPLIVNKGRADRNIEIRSRFKWIQERIDAEISKGGIIHIKSLHSLRPTIERHYDQDIVRAPTTLLSKKINKMPTNTDGNREMKDFFGISPFDYPKPTALIKFLIQSATYFQKGWVMDFFGGSGTTAQAVIELNAEDKKRRQYVLIENAQYFDPILLHRIKKVMFSRTWKNGKPTQLTGYRHMLKYYQIS